MSQLKFIIIIIKEICYLDYLLQSYRILKLLAQPASTFSFVPLECYVINLH